MKHHRDKLTLDQLRSSKSTHKALNILSFDPEIYLLEVVIDDKYFMLTDESGGNLVFRSATAAKKVMAGIDVTRTTLVHSSSYDEMVGLGPKPDSNLLIVPTAGPEQETKS